MKILRFLVFITLSVAFIYHLDIIHDTIPPAGKLLNPVSGFWQNTPIILGDTMEMDFTSLNKEVDIYYDQHLIPHVFAQNDADLYFAVGYVTARHRLWQMEFQTYFAAGRISEIVGKKALPLDRKQRRLAAISSAEKTLNLWMKNDTVKQMLNRFTDGVNAYIDQLPEEKYPIEYKLLDYTPEHWTPLKTALLVNYMSSILTLKEYDIENTNLIQLLGKDVFNTLYPAYISDSNAVIPPGTPWDFETLSIPASYDSIVYVSDDITPYEKAPDGRGSNNWAVHPDKTKNGYAILANDMHLDYSLPSIWFQMHLNAPGINTFGHVIPGAPLVITGFNDSIAWGITNVARDVVDWYSITFRNSSRKEYLYDGEWLRTQQKVEKIKVRNGNTVIDTVIYTHLGPIVYDKNFGADNEHVNLAMKWITHEPTREAEALYKINRASNYQAFKKAVAIFSNPGSNFVFASRKGNIAMHVQGKFPVKYPDQGRFIMDGSTSKTNWNQYIPPSQLPQVLNPDRGFVSSANQTSTATDYPYYSYHSSYAFFRGQRINTVLDSLTDITPKDMMNLQLDDFNQLAAMALPFMLDSLPGGLLQDKEKDILSALKAWNLRYEAQSAAAVYFSMWWSHFRKELWDEVDLKDHAFYYPTNNITLDYLKNKTDSSFFDIKKTSHIESRKDLLLKTFHDTYLDIEKWVADNGDPLWYKYRDTHIEHLLKLPPFSYDNVTISGGKYSVKRVDPVVGASQRLVVEMGPEIKAWSTYPGGQSGNPGSKYYDNFLGDYLNDQYIQIDFFNSPENAHHSFSETLKLHPKP